MDTPCSTTVEDYAMLHAGLLCCSYSTLTHVLVVSCVASCNTVTAKAALTVCFLSGTTALVNAIDTNLVSLADSMQPLQQCCLSHLGCCLGLFSRNLLRSAAGCSQRLPPVIFT